MLFLPNCKNLWNNKQKRLVHHTKNLFQLKTNIKWHVFTLFATMYHSPNLTIQHKLCWARHLLTHTIYVHTNFVLLHRFTKKKYEKKLYLLERTSCDDFNVSYLCYATGRIINSHTHLQMLLIGVLVSASLFSYIIRTSHVATYLCTLGWEILTTVFRDDFFVLFRCWYNLVSIVVKWKRKRYHLQTEFNTHTHIDNFRYKQLNVAP